MGDETASRSQNLHNGDKIADMARAGLDYLIADPQELNRFMNATGYEPDSLRAALDSSELNMAIMSYFAGNESSLLAMCANSDINPSAFMRCWQQLNG